MALKRLVIDGFGQLELNNVAFRRDGRVEAQCKLADGIDFVENGMLLAIDNVTRTVAMPGGNDKYIGLNYSAEHMYDERTPGLKNFKLEKDSFLPRLGYLSRGDKFTTNCIAYDSSDFANDDTLKAVELTGNNAQTLYGQPCALGAIQVTKTAPNANGLLVIAKTTMPDGQFAFKFQQL